MISSDIRTHPKIYGQRGLNFLESKRKVDNIITNPPHSLAEEFVRHALKLAKKKVAMFLKLLFLESKGRYELLTKSPLKSVYVFSGRVHCLDVESKTTGGMIAFAWFVWDKTMPKNKKPTIGWILKEEDEENWTQD